MLRDEIVVFTEEEEVIIIVDDILTIPISAVDTKLSPDIKIRVYTPEVIVPVNFDEIAESSGPTTHYGRINRPFTFRSTIQGTRTSGSGAILGVVVRPFVVTIATAGVQSANSPLYGSGLYGSGTYSIVPPPTTQFGSIAFPITAGISSRSEYPQTAIAEISLSPHSTPSSRTNHSIKIRARTLTGSGGVIKAALYEGSINRSGDLVSGTLTNSLSEYTLNISDAAAATITNYDNLSLKIWGYDINGTGLVFEVSNAYLALPSGGYKQTPIAEISLSPHGIPPSRTNHSIKIRARTTSSLGGVIKAALYEGAINRSGVLNSGGLTNVLTDQSLTIPEALAETITDYTNLSVKFWGYDAGLSGLIFEVSKVHLELPLSSSGIKYGATSLVANFGRTTSAIVEKKTPVAEISLASHGTPSSRTNHSIKIRARTTSGSGGILKAALYEGTVNRSGDLSSGTLSTSLADYTLTIPDASAAAITSYTNLSIKIWGYDSSGAGLIFEVTKLFLELPA